MAIHSIVHIRESIGPLADELGVNRLCQALQQQDVSRAPSSAPSGVSSARQPSAVELVTQALSESLPYADSSAPGGALSRGPSMGVDGGQGRATASGRAASEELMEPTTGPASGPPAQPQPGLAARPTGERAASAADPGSSGALHDACVLPGWWASPVCLCPVSHAMLDGLRSEYPTGCEVLSPPSPARTPASSPQARCERMHDVRAGGSEPAEGTVTAEASFASQPGPSSTHLVERGGSSTASGTPAPGISPHSSILSTPMRAGAGGSYSPAVALAPVSTSAVARGPPSPGQQGVHVVNPAFDPIEGLRAGSEGGESACELPGSSGGGVAVDTPTGDGGGAGGPSIAEHAQASLQVGCAVYA